MEQIITVVKILMKNVRHAERVGDMKQDRQKT
jgi:hypothetical protein